MRYLAILILSIAAFGACESEESCDQWAVDECYAAQGCEGSTLCSLDVDGANALCVCLTERSCDQDWFHTLCDDAPYDAGTCPCGE